MTINVTHQNFNIEPLAPFHNHARKHVDELHWSKYRGGEVLEEDVNESPNYRGGETLETGIREPPKYSGGETSEAGEC